MKAKNLERDYGHHAPRNDYQAHQHVEVRDQYRELGSFIEHALPDGREKALAHTYLEQSMMMANAALARARYDEEGS